MRSLAAGQEGLVAKFHLPLIECTSKHWTRARENGRWDVLSPRLLRVTGAPESDAQRALAAVLDASPGAMLHGRSALAWWGLQGFNLGQLHVARSRFITGRPAELGVLHKLRDVRPHDLVVVRGVPTETTLRAIWAEAAQYAAKPRRTMGMQRIGRLLDYAHRLGLVTWAALHESLEDLPERGRSGTVIMRQLAQDRSPGSSPTESRNEDRLEEILARGRQKPLRRQVVIGGHEPIGRGDFRDPELPLAVEVNSLSFHTAPSDREADQLRYRRFNDAGFTVGVVWEDDLWRQERAALRTVLDARQAAREGRPVVVHSPSCPWPA